MPADPHESRIREFLAHRLDILEPGLRLVDQEYRLPNSNGTGGRIDILARDQHQMWVVIELKRANRSARETAQELTKYAELLRREKGLPQHRIRTMAVALEPQWRELLAPLSNLARKWDHDLRGYSLTVDNDGVPTAARRVELLSEPVEQRLTSTHVIFLFDDSAKRDACWQWTVRSAADAHAIDLVGVHLDYDGTSDIVIYPHALYLAFGRIDNRDGESPCAHLCRHGVLDDEERAEYVYPDEYDALTHVCATIRSDDKESAGPDKFTQITNEENWTISKIHTTGAFATGLYDDDDIVRALRGHEGEAKVQYRGSASNKIIGQWREFRKAVMTCLSQNDDWTELVGNWLDWLAQKAEEYDVHLHIYNPCDIITTLVYGLPDQLKKYSPLVLGVAKARDGHAATYFLRGELRWNGIQVPHLGALTRIVYRDPISWHIQRGETHPLDLQSLRFWGIHYLTHEFAMDPTSPADAEHKASIHFPSSLTAEEIGEWGGVFPLDTFIDHHLEQISLLVQDYGNRSIWTSRS
ncbi:endonuclease NucS domain-containing protein [Nocardia abscessus]|uniref:endonuclease NucS domain-containing protein n=1 Tax=Nocardia abscessus TaxID=120957 RepID=UPI0002D98D88|nr:endonuclease NucS domain-containing protein [Nocardia abscessus]MCC3326472.1 endonuclease NucS [Nocardia abscessus]